MRIAVVGPSEPRELAEFLHPASETVPSGLGGSPVTALARSLLELGHTVILITASPDVSETVRFEGETLSVRIVPYRARPRERALDLFHLERLAIAEELARVQYDIAHAHWSYEFAWPVVVDGRPHLVTVHDAPLTILRYMPDAYRLMRLLMALRVRGSLRNVTAVSPYLARKWRVELAYFRKVPVIPNPLPGSWVERHETDSERRIVLCVADASRRKNVRTLLRAFAIVSASRPDLELHLVGNGLGTDGGLAAWWARQDSSLPVRFLGPMAHESVLERLESALVLVHPSLEETFGMVLIEALAAGVPVIAGSRSGAVAWTLDDGRAGILVDVRRPKELGQGILETLMQPDRTRAMTQRGQSVVKERYGARHIALQYLEEYRRCLSGEDSVR